VVSSTNKTDCLKIRGNKEWTIQRNWQHWAHKTQYENEQNTTQKTKKMSNTDPTKNTTQKTKKMSNTDPTKNQGLVLVLLYGKHIVITKDFIRTELMGA
jgi:hypothetical protein